MKDPLETNRRSAKQPSLNRIRAFVATTNPFHGYFVSSESGELIYPTSDTAVQSPRSTIHWSSLLSLANLGTSLLKTPSLTLQILTALHSAHDLVSDPCNSLQLLANRLYRHLSALGRLYEHLVRYQDAGALVALEIAILTIQRFAHVEEKELLSG